MRENPHSREPLKGGEEGFLHVGRRLGVVKGPVACLEGWYLGRSVFLSVIRKERENESSTDDSYRFLFLSMWLVRKASLPTQTAGYGFPACP